MASIRPLGNRYRAFVKVDGRRATKVFDTKRAALAWAQEQEALLTGSQLPDKKHWRRRSPSTRKR